MSSLVLHIPHASPHIPCLEGFVVSPEELEAEVALLTDWYTDELFGFDKAEIIKAHFSRIFCDVERFADDSQEVMAACGMGMAYISTDSGQMMREVSSELRGRILEEYYYPHHRRLEIAVRRALNQTGKAIIVDAHSFPDIPFCRDLDKSPDRPDICLGVDQFHTSDSLLEHSVAFFTAHGFKVEINRPYSGAVVPLAFYRDNKAVESILVEINKKLYLSGESKGKREEFGVLKDLVGEYLRTIESLG